MFSRFRARVHNIVVYWRGCDNLVINVYKSKILFDLYGTTKFQIAIRQSTCVYKKIHTNPEQLSSTERTLQQKIVVRNQNRFRAAVKIKNIFTHGSRRVAHTTWGSRRVAAQQKLFATSPSMSLIKNKVIACVMQVFISATLRLSH